MPPSEPVVYLRGEFIPANDASISIFDLSVVQGVTVTDQLRTFHHQPFRISDHMERFFRSCQYARIIPPLSLQKTTQATEQLIKHNAALLTPEQDLGVVLFVSPGEHGAYSNCSKSGTDPQATLCIHSFPLSFERWQTFFDVGAHVVTPTVRHVPPQCLEPKVKHRSRLHWWIAQQETKLVDPQATPLLLDLEGNITETVSSNFLIVQDETVISPTPRNILRGISLLTVAELCSELAIAYIERDFQIYEVINADEALLTTTPYCLAPATRINGIPIGKGTPGPMFHRLMQAWNQRVGLDILQQIQLGNP